MTLQYPSKILYCLILLSLTACHIRDPLEPLNRKVYALNSALRPLIIQPAVDVYAFIVPRQITTMVLNNKIFVQYTFSTPVYALQGHDILGLYNRFVLDLLLGGAGSTALSSTLYPPLPASPDRSWPIVLPIMGPIGVVPFIGATLGVYGLGVFIPAPILRIWSFTGALGKESVSRTIMSSIARQADPYAAHIAMMYASEDAVGDAQTFALPDF